MTYLKFLAFEEKELQVWNKKNQSLGKITFHLLWKKYVFEPSNNTYYDNLCLKEIVDKLEELNK